MHKFLLHVSIFDMYISQLHGLVSQIAQVNFKNWCI